MSPPIELLVVDDDPMMAKHVGQIARLTLSNIVRVSIATDVRTALERLAAHDPRGVRLVVVSDYNLGAGRTGLEVLEAARRVDPAARLILMSGEHPSVFVEIREREDLDFLEKPFTLEQMRASLERAATSA